MKKKCIAVCRVSLMAVGLVAMAAMPLAAASAGDLHYYYDLALKNDPQFRGAESDSKANRESLRQAYAGLQPKLNAELSFSHTYQRINSTDNQVYAAGSTQYDTRAYGLNLSQPIFRFASLVSVEQAKTVLNRADLELEKARQDLALRVIETYIEVLAARDRLLAIKAEESAVALHHEQAKERFEKGMAAITDRYDTEARLAAVRAQRVEAENAIHDALQALTEICGAPVEDIKPLKNDIPLNQPFPEDIGQWAEAGMRQNLDVLIRKSHATVAEKEVTRQRAGHYPTLDLLADSVNSDTKGSLFGGGSDTTTSEVMLKLNMPIFEGGLVTSRTREASHLHQSALQALTKQNRAVERQVRATYNGILSAITRVKAMQKSVEAQQLVVEAKEEGFRAGLYISLAVLDAMQDLYRYKKEYSLARNEFILNSFRLKHVVGALKAEDLNLINTWLQD